MASKMLLNKYKLKRKKVKIIYWKILLIKVIMKTFNFNYNKTIISSQSQMLYKMK